MKYIPVDLIEVIYDGRSVGALAPDPGSGYYAFEYDPKFIKEGIELSPLAMPLSRGEPTIFPYLPEATYHRLPPFIADSLPDSFGNALINVWMSRNGIDRERISILDRLAYIGKRGMGALEFKPMIRMKEQRPTALEMNDLVSTARKAVKIGIGNKGIPGASDIAVKQLISVGTSAGGARAKAVVGFNPTEKKFMSGQFKLPEGYEHWMIKFDLPEQEGATTSREYGRIEYAYYLMAKDCGIQMTEARLVELENRFHFMTKRFDRDINRKIHMQSLCAMSELDFNQRATHDYIQLFQTVNELGLDYESVDQTFIRMVFNVIMCNNDDHSKNHAFLLTDDGWQLSPAYDLTFASDHSNIWLNQHLMGVNGKFMDISDDDMLMLGKRFFVKKPNSIINHVREVSFNWKDYAQKAGLSEQETERINSELTSKF